MTRRSNAKKTAHVPRTRCTVEERALIDAKAAQAGLSPSEYTRRACLETVVVVRGNAIDAQAVRQLAAIGNNVNQIARKLNRMNDGAAIVPASELAHLRGISATLEALIDELI